MSAESQHFFALTPERVLDAVEKSGLRCTGRCLALNSYENRVYEVELDLDAEPAHPYDNRRVVKFYRPGRWTQDQILEEHQFLLDLKENEIPVVFPIPFESGETLHRTDAGDLWYALFPKVGGRIPDELAPDQLQWIGRLLARIHNVGAARKALHRVRLTSQTYASDDLTFLLQGKWIPSDLEDRYKSAIHQIIRVADPLLEKTAASRIHGDCHLGNLLWGKEGPFFLDFDDMLVGPAVQDVWLLVSGRDTQAEQDRKILLDGYQEMRDFDGSSLELIEILRSFRFVHYTAWLAKRWEDPAFPRAFPHFNSRQYWEEKTRDLEEQLGWILT